MLVKTRGQLYSQRTHLATVFRRHCMLFLFGESACRFAHVGRRKGALGRSGFDYLSPRESMYHIDSRNPRGYFESSELTALNYKLIGSAELAERQEKKDYATGCAASPACPSGRPHIVGDAVKAASAENFKNICEL